MIKVIERIQRCLPKASSIVLEILDVVNKELNDLDSIKPIVKKSNNQIIITIPWKGICKDDIDFLVNKDNIVLKINCAKDGNCNS